MLHNCSRPRSREIVQRKSLFVTAAASRQTRPIKGMVDNDICKASCVVGNKPGVIKDLVPSMTDGICGLKWSKVDQHGASRVEEHARAHRCAEGRQKPSSLQHDTV